jgi:integral membrane protein (TIGR01906 family)
MRPSAKATWAAAVLFPFMIVLLFSSVLIFDVQLNSALLAPDAVPATLQILEYYHGRAAMPDVFNAREQEHMGDVKKVVNSVEALALILFIAFLVLLPRADISKVFTRGFFLLLALALILFVFPFDLVFERFHQLVFPADSWVFAPDSTLIQLYPFSFFQAFFQHILVHSMVFAAVLALFGSLLHHHKA